MRAHQMAFRLVVVSIGLAGCHLVVNHGNLPPPRTLSPGGKSLGVYFAPAGDRWVTLDERETILSGFRDSGIFTSVEQLRSLPETIDADILARVELNREETTSKLLLLTVLTLGVVPFYDVVTYGLHVTFSDRNRTILASVDRSDHVTTIFGLLVPPLTEERDKAESNLVRGQARWAVEEMESRSRL